MNLYPYRLALTSDVLTVKDIHYQYAEDEQTSLWFSLGKLAHFPPMIEPTFEDVTSLASFDGRNRLNEGPGRGGGGEI